MEIKSVLKNELKKIYFIILFKRKKEEKSDDFKFKNNNEPKCIFSKINESKHSFLYIKIFKYNIKIGKKRNQINLEFSIDNENYRISFDVKDNSFIFNVDLEKYIYFVNIKMIIDQNVISLGEKMNYFIESLIQSKEEDKLKDLYLDSINLYSKKKVLIF